MVTTSKALTNAVIQAYKKSAETDQSKGIDFDTWDESLTKIEVSVVLEIPFQDDEKLGEVKMDLKAPIAVMREYIYRNFRSRLNEICGEQFLFFCAKDDDEAGTGEVVEILLARAKEVMVYTGDFAPFKMDTKTMEGINKIVIVIDPEFKLGDPILQHISAVKKKKEQGV